MLQIIYVLNKEILQKSLCKFAALSLLCKQKNGWPQGLFDILAEICILHVVNWQCQAGSGILFAWYLVLSCANPIKNSNPLFTTFNIFGYKYA
jgi:hypothetical protein